MQKVVITMINGLRYVAYGNAETLADTLRLKTAIMFHEIYVSEYDKDEFKTIYVNISNILTIEDYLKN